MDAFADSYVAGATPVPCVLCNQTVKFRDLLATAEDEYRAVATYVTETAGRDAFAFPYRTECLALDRASSP